MRPVSDIPKPMLPVGGKPLVARQLELLKTFGIHEVFLCLGYRPEAFREYLGDGSKMGMKLDYRVEDVERGTAGAVRDIKADVRGGLLVIYGDLFVDFDCQKLMDFHQTHDPAATLVVRRSDHPRDSDLVREEEGFVKALYRNKEAGPDENLALAAVWVVTPRLLEIIPADRPSDFGRDIFPKALAQGLPLAAYETTERIADIGTPERREAFLKEWEAHS